MYVQNDTAFTMHSVSLSTFREIFRFREKFHDIFNFRETKFREIRKISPFSHGFRIFAKIKKKHFRFTLVT
jgi:hypothetical protein